MTKRCILACLAVALIAAAPARETEHQVEPGETLNGIANRAGVKASEIAKANGLEPPYALRVGQTLAIPRKAPARKDTAAAPSIAGSHVVEPGETLNGIANRAGVSPAALARANDLQEPYPLRAGQKLVIPGARPAPSPRAAPAARPAAGGGAAASESEHVVEPGETLGGIANRAGVPLRLIAEANGLAAPYPVRAGQKLLIPRAKSHLVAEGDTGFGIAYRYGVPWKTIAQANGLDEDAVVRSGQKLVIPTLTRAPSPAPAQPATPAPAAAPKPAPSGDEAPAFQWPLRGATLLGFTAPGRADSHNGIDLAAEAGAPVKAAAAGKVVFAGEEPKIYGTLVVLEHGNGWHSAYGHLSSVSVKVGDRVAAGDAVGKAGQTGVAHRPALHFEIRKDNMPVDPARRIAGPSAP